MIEALPAKTIQEADTSGADRSPESPASSLGSDCASSTASAAVVGMGRSFPKPSKVKRYAFVVGRPTVLAANCESPCLGIVSHVSL